MPETAQEAQELAVLWGICHAFGSTSEIDKIVPATTYWVREALGSPDAGIRLSFERRGRLEVVGSEAMGPLPGEDTRNVAQRRRSVFNEKQPVVSTLPDRPHLGLAVLPLVSRGLALGVVEVVAPQDRLSNRWHTLEAVVSQVAILVRNLNNQSRLDREVKALEGSVDLVHELLRASTADEAVRSSLALLHDPYGIPAAAWLYSDAEGCFELLATTGIPKQAARELAALERIPSWDDEMSAERCDRLIGRFREAAGGSEVETLVSNRVVLLAGIDGDHQVSGLKTVTGLMFEALKNLSNVKLAESRNQTLDSAIGFAAHELKAPLAATKMLIDTLRQTGRVERLMPALERSSAELSDLWSLVETLMEWSVGDPHLELGEVPVLDLLADAVRSVDEGETCNIDARVAGDLKMTGDGRQLRLAFTSLLRSALKHGSPHPVEIAVFTEGNNVVTRIKDEGPPIPPEAEDALFDPFLRDRKMTTRVSKGLGLFTARKIFEAHGGRIMSERRSAGACLRVQLPLSSQELISGYGLR